MKRTQMKLAITGTLLALSVTNSAHANLMLDIQDAGGGQTTWTFRGSATVSTGTNSSSGYYTFWGQNWDAGLGEPISSSATGSYSIASQNASECTTSYGCITTFNDVYLGYQYLGAGDSILGPRNFAEQPTWSPGEVLSWSGSMLVNAGIDNFNAGTYSTSTILGATLRDSLIVNIGGSVPEPASLALMGLGLAGLGLSRRKAKQQ